MFKVTLILHLFRAIVKYFAFHSKVTTISSINLIQMKHIITLLTLVTLLTSCAPTKAIPQQNAPTLQMDQSLLEESLQLGSTYLLNNQLEAGDFVYEYDFSTQTFSEDNNQVRQAGALWGLSLLYKNNPTKELEDAVIRGILFFEEHSQVPSEIPDGGRFIAFPGEDEGKTGTQALATLALIEFLSAQPTVQTEPYEILLDDYLSFLRSLERKDGLIYGNYEFETGFGYGTASPYSDGEALLAFVKAAKTAGYSEYGSWLGDMAETMYTAHVEEALRLHPDSDTTKGFYQWGSMAFYELYTSDWKKKRYATWTIDLAHWMIDTHEVLTRTRNTAYAFEGILSAYELAKLTGDEEAAAKFAQATSDGLYKLTTWQVGHSLQNHYLEDFPTDDPFALGGVMNAASEPLLRIDVAQHQMHAVQMALDYGYNQ